MDVLVLNLALRGGGGEKVHSGCVDPLDADVKSQMVACEVI